MRQPIFFYLRPRGSAEHRRYLITDDFGNCFDGKGFGLEAKGMLFATFTEAAFAVQQLLVEACGSRKHVTRYVAPIQIVVHSDEPLDIEDVRAWALKVARLILETPQHGNGPIDNSLGLVQINWDELEEVE